MPTTIATEQGVPAARRRQTATAYGFLRSRRLYFLLAVWAVTVLLIGTQASLSGRPFLSDFDVSVAPF
jgi:hypothetical protein